MASILDMTHAAILLPGQLGCEMRADWLVKVVQTGCRARPWGESRDVPGETDGTSRFRKEWPGGTASAMQTEM
jgi:hypothetical protein